MPTTPFVVTWSIKEKSQISPYKLVFEIELDLNPLPNNVKTYVTQCLTSKQMKYETKRLAILLKLFPSLTSVWEDLSSGFVFGLPPSLRFTAFWLLIISGFCLPSTLPSRLPPYFFIWLASYTAFPVAVFLIMTPSLLNCFVSVAPIFKWAPPTNTSDHFDTGFSPIEVTYGKLLPSYILGSLNWRLLTWLLPVYTVLTNMHYC